MSMTTKLIKKLREVAKKYYGNNGSNEYEVFKYLHEAANVIEELSSKLQAANMERSSMYYHGGWISVDERLPEEPYGCIVTVIDTNPITGEDFENILPYFVGYDGKTWNDAGGEQCPFEVLAWCPLPEPYSHNEKEVENADSD